MVEKSVYSKKKYVLLVSYNSEVFDKIELNILDVDAKAEEVVLWNK